MRLEALRGSERRVVRRIVGMVGLTPDETPIKYVALKSVRLLLYQFRTIVSYVTCATWSDFVISNFNISVSLSI